MSSLQEATSADFSATDALSKCVFPGMGYGKVLQVRSMQPDGRYMLQAFSLAAGNE